MLELNLRTMARNWWTFLVRGILAILFGIVAILWPDLTVTALVIFFGAFALVDGIFAIAAAIVGATGDTPRWLLVVEGILGIAVGVVAWLWPGLTAVTLLYFIAAWAILTGIIEIAGAISLRREIENEWMLGIAGALSVLLGIVFIAFPIAALTTIALVAGVYALIFGVILIALAFRLRGLSQDIERQEPSPA